ncbi:hypothetical protein BHE74_00027829 [Ensete ventricosum]|nr:hypothetical protein BHE74_00027829 [Ensete ventricosum]
MSPALPASLGGVSPCLPCPHPDKSPLYLKVPPNVGCHKSAVVPLATGRQRCWRTAAGFQDDASEVKISAIEATTIGAARSCYPDKPSSVTGNWWPSHRKQVVAAFYSRLLRCPATSTTGFRRRMKS